MNNSTFSILTQFLYNLKFFQFFKNHEFLLESNETRPISRIVSVSDISSVYLVSIGRHSPYIIFRMKNETEINVDLADLKTYRLQS